MAGERGWRVITAKAYCLAVAVVVGLVCLAITGNPERHAFTAAMQYLPYLVFLLPAIGACLCSLWLRWPWRALAGGSLVLVLTVLMGLTVGWPDGGYGHVRVMTYNAKVSYALDRPNGLGELAQEIIAHDPDVLLMQDAGELMGIQRSKPELVKAVLGKREVYSFGQYIVASRLPIRDCAPGWIPFGSLMHSYVHCVLTAHGKDIDLVTVHFLTPREGLNAVRHKGLKGLKAWQGNMLNRLTQSRELASQLSHMTRPRIVAGDLNAPERSAVVQNLLQTGLRDVYSSSTIGYGFTHGHSLKLKTSFVRIDHVLVSDDIGVAHAEVGGSVASQHRPVITDLNMVRE